MPLGEWFDRDLKYLLLLEICCFTLEQEGSEFPRVPAAPVSTLQREKVLNSHQIYFIYLRAKSCGNRTQREVGCLDREITLK